MCMFRSSFRLFCVFTLLARDVWLGCMLWDVWRSKGSAQAQTNSNILIDADHPNAQSARRRQAIVLTPPPRRLLPSKHWPQGLWSGCWHAGNALRASRLDDGSVILRTPVDTMPQCPDTRRFGMNERIVFSSPPGSHDHKMMQVYAHRITCCLIGEHTENCHSSCNDWWQKCTFRPLVV